MCDNFLLYFILKVCKMILLRLYNVFIFFLLRFRCFSWVCQPSELIWWAFYLVLTTYVFEEILILSSYELRREKTSFLHMRKQRRRSASR